MTVRPSPLRIALVGAGMISAHHLLAWRKRGDAAVVAVVDPDIGRARAQAEAHGVAHWHASLSEAIERNALDAVDIASPRQTHAALVRQAAAAGLHVLCQKPLAPTLAEARSLVDEIKGRVRLMVHENWRFRPYYRQINAWMREGQFGALTTGSIAVRSSGLLPDGAGRHPSLERQPFFRTEARLLVAETLIHHLDVARWLCGPLRMVAARLARTTEAVIGDTAAHLLLETADGAPVSISGNLTCPGYPPASSDRVELIGRGDSITLADNVLQRLGPAPETLRYVHAEAYQACFDSAIGHFVERLRDGAPFETEARDNLDTLALVEDAYRLSGFEA